jgi:hypothetical protein
MRCHSQPSSPQRHRHAAWDAEWIAAAPLSGMVLDASGTIQRCDPMLAEVLQATQEAVVGRHVTAFIPDLPLKPATPGYNLAFATFCAVRPVWLKFKGLVRANLSRAFYVTFEAPRSGKHQRIVVRLNPVAKHGAFGPVALDGALLAAPA